ncbi:hypothetical protein O181_117024 [Austropuccinia psidii MF-1]|uniref:ELP1 first N-terminal beta-propeller domain-containing protein n=1 Tax=Austropuccinia psidii MF-1 TaxID=1389203 RepID=A0A9Q3PX41_9BASI|nr:hypothetical protein [Austropuccinia psidii MF-1]
MSSETVFWWYICTLQFDSIGTFDDGIFFGSWSPDDELLVIVTDSSKLVLLIKTFDVLSEAPIDFSWLGDDQPVNLGWGTKSTQFHGSLGKSAAQVSEAKTLPFATIPPKSFSLNAYKLSWRGDESLSEELVQLQEQLTKQVDCLAKLKLVRDTNPELFFLNHMDENNGALDGVDAMTNVSTVFHTDYSRYTQGIQKSHLVSTSRSAHSSSSLAHPLIKHLVMNSVAEPQGCKKKQRAKRVVFMKKSTCLALWPKFSQKSYLLYKILWEVYCQRLYK